MAMSWRQEGTVGSEKSLTNTSKRVSGAVDTPLASGRPGREPGSRSDQREVQVPTMPPNLDVRSERRCRQWFLGIAKVAWLEEARSVGGGDLDI